MNQENFPEHWKVVRLGDYIFKPEYGYTASAVKDSIGTKFLRITDIQDDSVDWKDVPYCKCDDDTKKKYLLVPGDIVIARIGATTGKTFLVNDCPESIFASYLIRVKTKSSLLSEFLSTYFRTEDYWGQIRQNKGGRLKGGVNIPILQNLKIPLPPLPEQRSIAHILQTIQEAKSTRQREAELERECKAVLLDRLFSHGTKGEPRKQTEIGKIPESWELVRLGDVLGYIGNGLTNKQNKVSDGYPVTRIETISDDCINAEKVGYVNALPEDKIEKYRLCYGDMLVSHINSDPQLGRSVIYEGEPEFLLHGMNLLRMRANTEMLDPFFLNLIFRFYRNRGVFITLASRAVGQSSINQSRMKSLIIPFPALPEQRVIAEILQACDTKIAALEQETALLDELFHAMLDELMIGNRSAVPLIDREE